MPAWQEGKKSKYHVAARATKKSNWCLSNTPIKNKFYNIHRYSAGTYSSSKLYIPAGGDHRPHITPGASAWGYDC
jgi:hypothetical protein